MSGTGKGLPAPKRERAVQRIDGNYLYQVGAQIHPIAAISSFTANGSATTMQEALYPLIQAEAALDPLLNRSIYRLRTSVASGRILLDLIREIKRKIETTSDKKQPLEIFDIFAIQNAVNNFEAIFGAEIGQMPIYVVTQKAGFDTPTLIERGSLCFPLEIYEKVPAAIADLEQATRCIAYELPTAAGFHLHRANESVLHRYWDAVTKNADRPATRNMGDYLAAMNKKNVGDPKVKSALKDLKDLHRNPLIHPQDSLTMDEAIALMNGIYTVMVHMLKVIPTPPIETPWLETPVSDLIPETTDPLPGEK